MKGTKVLAWDVTKMRHRPDRDIPSCIQLTVPTDGSWLFGARDARWNDDKSPYSING